MHTNLHVSLQRLRLFACTLRARTRCQYAADMINWPLLICSAAAPGQNVTHAGTQTVCVTHSVTHGCPPAQLAQLCTSEMGLGLKTAGEATQPCSNNAQGRGFGRDPLVTTHTDTEEYRAHLPDTALWTGVCVSCDCNVRLPADTSAVCLASEAVDFRRHSPQSPGTAPLSATSWRPQGPSGLPSPCFHTSKHS